MSELGCFAFIEERGRRLRIQILLSYSVEQLARVYLFRIFEGQSSSRTVQTNTIA